MGASAKLSSIIDVTPKSDDQLTAILKKQREAFSAHGAPSYEERIANLDRIIGLTRKYKDEICEAICEDFGNRSKHESMLAEVMTTVNAAKHAKKKLKGWMKPRSAPLALTLLPGRGKIHYQPIGVVGIMSPWNYPFQLAVVPVIEALAAGNRVMLKPSELTPRTSDLMKKMMAEEFDESEVAVCTGGPEVGQAFSSLRLDHLLYTGSTRVGRLVMKAAADNMVPVTLELGGKSPAVIGPDADIERSIKGIATGKLMNGGQTCVAPDYCFVPESKADEFVEAFKKRASEMYPTLVDNPDFTSIVSDNHYERITRLIEDAVAKGAKIVQVNPQNESGEAIAAKRKIAPTLVLNVNDDMEIMQEEIFGPVMPVKTYKDLQEAIDYINDHPRPLALYYFGESNDDRDRVLGKTISGGACVNDTIWQLAHEELPFGGVGPSGTGSYHGWAGFQTFSHRRSVFYQSKFNLAGMMRPPYGAKIEKLLARMIG